MAEVVITRPLPGDPVARFAAAGFADVWVNPRDVRPARPELLAAIVGSRAVVATPADTLIDPEFFDAAGPRLVRGGAWRGVGPNQLLGHRVHGSTLLIVGAGRIGLATARRAVGFEVNVLYHARRRHPDLEAAPIGARGAVVDEAAFVAALRDGTIAALRGEPVPRAL
ncbi:MAG: NAD(P)-dependent oxidoreductase [Planctomycetota bacterium]|jgi:hypothetical protein